MRQIHYCHWLISGLADLLHGNALTDREGSTHRIMTTHDLITAVVKHIDIQWSMNAERNRDVIKIARGLKLMQEPQPLLRKRERQIVRTSDRVDSTDLCRFFAAEQFLNRSRLVCNRGLLKNTAERQRDPKNSPYARSNLQGEQRMSA